MKKLYSKPEIMFESFTLSASIASCDNIIDTQSKDQCGIEGTGGIKMFSHGITDCDFEASNDEYDGFCYHVFDGTTSGFLLGS